MRATPPDDIEKFGDGDFTHLQRHDLCFVRILEHEGAIFQQRSWRQLHPQFKQRPPKGSPFR